MAEAAKKTSVSRESRGSEPAPAPARERDWHPMLSLRDEIDRLFDDFSSGFFAPFWPSHRRMLEPEPTRGIRAQSLMGAPRVDVVEREKEYCIKAEIPGLSDKDIEVVVSNGRLTIKGEKREERQEERENYHLSERSYGSFQRSFQLPDSVDEGKIEAISRNGVLTIRMPKTEQAVQQEKRIAIKAE